MDIILIIPLRTSIKTSKELKELQYEYKSLKSEVMFRSKQSELAHAVEPLGLERIGAAANDFERQRGN